MELATLIVPSISEMYRLIDLKNGDLIVIENNPDEDEDKLMYIYKDGRFERILWYI